MEYYAVVRRMNLTDIMDLEGFYTKLFSGKNPVVKAPE